VTSKNSLNNKDLAHQLMIKKGTLSRKECEERVDEVIQLIRDNLVKGNEVNLKNIGLLFKKERKPFVPKKPLARKDGQEARFNDRKVLSVIHFKQSTNIKKEINGKL
jgi:nucleoid DNA-binding protein